MNEFTYLGIDWGIGFELVEGYPQRPRAERRAALAMTDPTLNDRLDDLVFAG